MALAERIRVLMVYAKPAIARAVAARPDLDVTILCPQRQRPEFEALGCGAALCDEPYVPGAKLSLAAIRSVRRAIARAKPDVVHAFYPRALAHTVLATVGLADRPRIVSYRGVTAPAPRWSPVQRISYQSPRVDWHACESAAVRDALVASGVPAERCGVVFNCLNGPLASCDRRTARDAWGVPEDAFVVAMTANMRAVKGADVLLRAAAACRDLARVHFVLMGRVHDLRLPKLSAAARLEGRLQLTGYLPDAPTLSGAADLFVMPSRAEALSVALLEAMGQGVCPVVSDAGGMKEAVRHGQDGWVFPSGDWGALAAAIRTLSSDDALRQRLAASAKRRVAEAFSPEAVAMRMADLYRGAVNHPATRARRAA
ncbi:MAG TPA: glycosyltransferase family 4 protein [Lacipirellulaceae bacterium]|nr:glycosyltransferase family 4 protein [Lacipirellulaceae bacterium]